MPAVKKRPLKQTNGGQSDNDVEQDRDDAAAQEEEEGHVQTAEQRRQLRKEYRQLQTFIDTNPDAFLAPKSEALKETLAKANIYQLQVVGTSEAQLDSRLIRNLSQLGLKKARQINAGISSFDVDGFIKKMATRMTISATDADLANDPNSMMDGDVDWLKLGKACLAHFKLPPSSNFLLGPLEVDIKSRAKRAKLSNKPVAAQTSPEELTKADIQQQENESAKNIKTIHDRLKRVGPTNLFRLVINPKSFSQSVENLFYVSFLIHEARVAIYFDKDEIPMIKTAVPPTEEERTDQGLTKRQLILDLDMKMWKDLIRLLEIKETIIPHRESTVQVNGANKWYG